MLTVVFLLSMQKQIKSRLVCSISSQYMNDINDIINSVRLKRLHVHRCNILDQSDIKLFIFTS